MPDVYADVAVPLPLEETYTYKVPESLLDTAKPGMRALVPFGKRKITGYIISINNRTQHAAPLPGIEAKDIIELLDEEPSFTESDIEYIKWAASYYLCPIGEAFKAALPAGINIQSSHVISATEHGRRALEAGILNEKRREVMAAVISAGAGIKLDSLLKRLSGKAGRAAIEGMAKDGLIQIADRLTNPTVKPLSVRIFKPSEKVPDDETVLGWEKRSRKRAQVYGLISSAGEIESDELNRRFPGATSSQVKWLIDKGYVVEETMRVLRAAKPHEIPHDGSIPDKLTGPQVLALHQITSALDKGQYKPFLLHGITGSGKTEIYMRAIGEAIKNGKGAIVLVPEISLTPQLLGRFRARFGDNVAVLHSALGGGERLDQWALVHMGKAKIALGARSAIFAPVKNLGIIVVDEEHDSSYKQEEGFKYNGRDLALVRAKAAEAVVVLGSATPSLESYKNAQDRRYGLLKLPERVEDRPLPKVRLIDMREAKLAEDSRFISEDLLEALRGVVERGEQAILFLNRRGYAPFLLCANCGNTFTCPNCSVGLTFHKDTLEITCHHCNHREPAPDECPSCKGTKIIMIGPGTERVEAEMKKYFPDAKVARLDRDTASRPAKLTKILTDLESGKVDILVGTQMVTKGHDYPNVTLVGVILADISLNMPDFRAAEKTFQLLTQVAGRAGRGERLGNVLIQTFNPHFYAIKLSLTHDYEAFADKELKVRKELAYPPFKRTALLRLSGLKPVATRKLAGLMGEIAREVKAVESIGPAPAPLSKLLGRFRWQMLLRAKNHTNIKNAANYIVKEMKPHLKKGFRLSVDIDPVDMI